MFSGNSSSTSGRTLPSDWIPQRFSSSRGPSPQISSMEELEEVNPILHSSHESSGSHRNTQPQLGDQRVENEGQDEAAQNEDPNPEPRAKTYRHPLPQPRPFDGKGERDIKLFFATFEKFCQSMWGNTRADWVAGLESYLKDWPLVLYNSLVNQQKTYQQIKSALQNAFPGVVDPFRSRNLLRLLHLKREAGEPLPVFFARVDSLIRETYPHLEEHSAALMCRDQFLMKLDQETASKIANYCNTRSDFDPETVREAAVVVGSPEFLHPGGGIPSNADIFLLQPNPKTQESRIRPQQIPKKEAEMRCMLCAGSWHPVSACVLYKTIFTCPLCREDPHPITDCRLYNEYNLISRSINQQTNRQGAYEYQPNTNHFNRNQTQVNRNNEAEYRWRNNRYVPRNEIRQNYDNPGQGRSRYPEPRNRSSEREGPRERRHEISLERRNYNRSTSEDRRQGNRFTDRLPAYREPYRYQQGQPRQGNF